MFGLEGANSMSPITRLACMSPTGSQVTPPFVVLQSPPRDDPIRTTSGSVGWTATALIRPATGPKFMPLGWMGAGPTSDHAVVGSAASGVDGAPEILSRDR